MRCYVRVKRHSNNDDNNIVILWEQVDDVCFYDRQPRRGTEFQCIRLYYSWLIIIIIIIMAIRQLLENASSDNRGTARSL